MRNLLLLVTYAGMAQAALLTPYFGPGSGAEDYGDWSGQTSHTRSCVGAIECAAGDGGARWLGIQNGWDGVGTVGASAFARADLGSVRSFADAFADIWITCADPCTEPIHDLVSVSGDALVWGTVLVISPGPGYVGYDAVIDGVPQGRTLVPVPAGIFQVGTFQSRANVHLYLAEVGTAHVEDHHSHDLLNIVWVPEPSTYALTMLGLVALGLRRR